MSKVRYVKLDEIKVSDLIALLNKKSIRKHLIEHPLFDSDMVENWVAEKNKIDSEKGCRVRGIYFEDGFAGWGGIQLEDEKYEIALVLDEKYWGLGKGIFTDIMGWAKSFGHQEVYINFLTTRPEYKFLRKLSQNVCQTEILGERFISYKLAIT
jgi:hypothetical protein